MPKARVMLTRSSDVDLSLEERCALANTNPWGDDPDTDAECSLPLSDLSLSAGDPVITDLCSFPSTVPNSAPKDCIFIPGDDNRLGVDTDTGNNGEVSKTVITLASFTATGHAGYVVVEWETASEMDNYGFNVWRSQAPDGSYTQINARLIPARGGPVFGASYSYDDETVSNGVTYWYKLEDVDLYGVSTMHGPVWATSYQWSWIRRPPVPK